MVNELPCGGCGAAVAEEARFCGACGARQPQESPADVARYAEALRLLGGRSESWAREELATLRRELRIRSATHDRLAAPAPVEGLPVGVDIDAATLDDLRAGEQGLVRLRVRNGGPRAVTLSVAARSTAGEPRVGEGGLIGPGEFLVVQILVHPTVAGHHTLRAEVDARSFGGEPAAYHTEDVPFRVGAAGALQQSIHIDARSQRVGVFENIGSASRGGLVGEARWRAVGVRQGRAPAAEAPAGPALPPVGARLVAVVAASGDPVSVRTESGCGGAIVDLEDPSLVRVLAPGDRIAVTVIGHDGRGGLVLSTREPRGAPAPIPSATRVGPADSLARALDAAPAGARLEVSGVHQGPFSVIRSIELWGDGVLEAGRGPVLLVSADAVVRGLTVRGAAGPGAYAADAVEVRGGRVVLERCTLSSDAPGNLTPGRALAVTGPAEVELRECRLHDAALGVAVDVSWSGFPTDTAPGARVRLVGGSVERVAVAIAVAGGHRAVAAAGTDLRGATEHAARAQRGASVTLEGCAARPGSTVAESGASVSVRGAGGSGGGR